MNTGTGYHGNILPQHRHAPYSFEFSDETERLGSTLVEEDLHKIAFQNDNQTSWVLTNLDPVEWKPLGGGGSWIRFDNDDARNSFTATDADLFRPAYVEETDEKWLLVSLDPLAWSPIGGGSGGSGDTSYIRLEPVTQNVGGIRAGDTFTGTLQDVFDAMFYPAVPPAFTSFSIQGLPSVLEVGDKILAGPRTFSWSYNAYKKVTLKPDTTKIEDVSGSVVYASDISNTSPTTKDIPADISRTTIGGNTWKISTQTSLNNVISSNFSVNWKAYSFFGISNSQVLSATEILALSNKRFQDGFVGNYTFPAGGYKWICYPKSFGNANVSKFKDVGTGFGVAIDPASPITVSVTNSFGVTMDYLCYRTMNVLNGSITISIGA